MTTMCSTRLLAVGLALLADLLVPTFVYAQAHPSALDDTARRTVVEKAAQALRMDYVSPEVGRQAATAIESALAAGHYRGLERPGAFAEKLTQNLHAVTPDEHLQVLGGGTAPAGAGAPSPPPRSQGGVARADRLAGNIGYIEIVAFGLPTWRGLRAPNSAG